ncbi:MAG: hypothetical protein M3R14_14870, partial [Acidobacteriota bacterium]|nr:hypothetical protein [Acidobacteriota bacterium]
ILKSYMPKIIRRLTSHWTRGGGNGKVSDACVSRPRQFGRWVKVLQENLNQSTIITFSSC